MEVEQQAGAAPPVDRSTWDKRADGSTKGDGFLGVLKRPDGKVSSEISIGVNLDGKEVEIPTLVPTLTAQERNWLITSDVSDPKKIPRSIVDKATAFARQRQQQGKPFFAQSGESPAAPTQSSSIPDGWEVVTAATPRPPTPPSAGTWEDRGIGGKVWHPADGGGSERTRVDNSVLGVPPELAVTGAIGVGRAVAGAGLSAAGRAVAGAKSVATQAAPVVKYELTRSALEGIGLPAPVAIAAAMFVSGYKHGGKGAATAATAAETTALDEAALSAGPVKAGSLTQEQLATRAAAVKAGQIAPTVAESPLALTQRLKAEARARVAATTPAASELPVPPGASVPGVPGPAGVPGARSGPPPAPVADPPSVPQTQKALNEEAILRRRAEYQARTAAAADPAPAPAAPAKPAYTAADAAEYLKLRATGKTHQQAVEVIEATKAFQARYGLTAPTVDAKTFPKGNRGKTS